MDKMPASKKKKNEYKDYLFCKHYLNYVEEFRYNFDSKKKQQICDMYHSVVRRYLKNSDKDMEKNNTASRSAFPPTRGVTVYPPTPSPPTPAPPPPLVVAVLLKQAVVRVKKYETAKK